MDQTATIAVKQVKQIWASPDGTRKIWALKCADGKVYRTFSEGIASSGGQEVQVVVYQRKNNKGETENFVKREQQQRSGGHGGGGHDNSRDASMALSYAKDLGAAKGSEVGEILQVADAFLAWIKDRSQETPAAKKPEEGPADDFASPAAGKGDDEDLPWGDEK